MRKSISVSFFSTASILLVSGIAVMGISEMYLVGEYFVKDKYATLDEVSRVAQYVISDAVEVQGEEVVPEVLIVDEDLDEQVELVAKSADVSIFLTDASGRVLLSSDEAVAVGTVVPDEILSIVALMGGESQHRLGTLSDFLGEQNYISARLIQQEAFGVVGYLFVCAPSTTLDLFRSDMFSNFLLSASVMFLCASILTMFLTNRLAAPLHEISAAAQKFGGGEMNTRVKVSGDDEVAQLAANFNTMAENLQAMDASRAQFMGNIAHELRTPMTTIKGFVDGVLDGTIPPELQNHYLQIVSQETGRLARLVQNMLDVTKLEAGEYQVRARLYPIEETLMGAALSAEQRINDGEIEIEGLSAAKTLVYADPDLVHQVVYNLLDNAIKFTPKGGTISFSVIRLGPEVEVSIQNSGEGIAAKALPFVFERFYKEDASRGLNAKGSGLGLHICKVLITLSGGQIHVDSKQGEWCKFTFTLPAEMPNKNQLPKLSDQTKE